MRRSHRSTSVVNVVTRVQETTVLPQSGVPYLNAPATTTILQIEAFKCPWGRVYRGGGSSFFKICTASQSTAVVDDRLSVGMVLLVSVPLWLL